MQISINDSSWHGVKRVRSYRKGIESGICPQPKLIEVISYQINRTTDAPVPALIKEQVNVG